MQIYIDIYISTCHIRLQGPKTIKLGKKSESSVLEHIETFFPEMTHFHFNKVELKKRVST